MGIGDRVGEGGGRAVGQGGGKGVENGVVGAQHVHGDQPGSEEGGAVIVQ